MNMKKIAAATALYLVSSAATAYVCGKFIAAGSGNMRYTDKKDIPSREAVDNAHRFIKDHMPDNMEHVVEHIDKYVADLNEDIESLKQHVSADRFSEDVLDGMTRNIQNRIKNLLITCAIVYKIKEGEMKLEWQEDTKRTAALKFEKEQEIINHLSSNS